MNPAVWPALEAWAARNEARRNTPPAPRPTRTPTDRYAYLERIDGRRKGDTK